ncbi:uncharacterized protein [Drosophila takahashii]|uniref:uncharacterized protein n=1 Tax=Drosophila takahashii TaxID=29030 RepID=UPI003898FE33
METWKIADCRAPGLLKLNLEDESDLLTSGKDPSGLEEATDVDAAYDELEDLKQRLIQLRSQILNLKPDSCEDQKVPENFSPQRQQLLELRRQKCQLICRLKEVKSHLKDTHKELEELEGWRCLLQSRIKKMNFQLSQFAEFRPRVIGHFGLCIERWEHQKTHKMDCATFRREMESHVNHADNTRKSLVSMKCHQRNRKQIRVELAMLRILLHNLFEAMVSDFQFFCRQLSINFTREPVDITSPNVPRTPTNSVSSFEAETRE